MKHRWIQLSALAALLCLLTGCKQPNTPTEPTTEPPTEPPIIAGWYQEDGQTCYRLEDGTFATGWLELEGKRYYLDENGILQTGWLEQDGKTYYLLETGAVATGKVEIDGKTHFFTSDGSRFLLVNPWNFLSDESLPELVYLDGKIGYSTIRFAAEHYDALAAMVQACQEQTGAPVFVISAYRSYQTQTSLYHNKIQQYIMKGYGPEEAAELAAKYVAVPGTSEHQTGLAVDIIDTRYVFLDATQATMPGQIWLMENSWRYGFILRYPMGKTDMTGINYEPWHYRYVGLELAAEIHESGLCLEEYFDQLTTQN